MQRLIPDKTFSHCEWEGGGGEQNPFSTLQEIQGKCWFEPGQLSNNFMHRKFIIHNVISLLLITITTHSLIRERKYLLHSVIIMENNKKNHQFHWPILTTLLLWYFLCISSSPPFKWGTWTSPWTPFTTWYSWKMHFCTGFLKDMN